MLEFSSVEKGQRETSVWFRQCKKDLQRFKKDRTIRLNLLDISQEDLPPRYSLTVRDTSGPSSGKNGLCAVFLVPQGRDSEWMFSSEEGQRTLCTDAGYKRFIIVVLNRGHEFSSLKDVQSELSPKMVQIAGRGTPSRSIPFMTIGGGIGSRKIIHEEVSEPSGRFFVEDVELDADSKSTRISRRLVFESNLDTTQTELRVSVTPLGEISFDFIYLSHAHQRAMAAALAMCSGIHQESASSEAQNDENHKPRILQVGPG
eukprot:956958_1